MRLKRWTCLLVFALALEAVPSFAAKDPPPTENLFSREYGDLLVEDARHVLTAPARWDGQDWLCLGVGTGAVVLTGAYLDKPLRDEIQENRGRTSDRLARIAGPFGFEYAPLVVGAFEAAGVVFQDDEAKQTAHDGVAATLLATGLVTGSLKLIVGRTRPFDQEGPHHFTPFSGEDSFPSGHSTEAFALATVISEHYDAPWVKITSYGTAALVGYSRMETDSHWTSDILAGAIIGIVVGKMVVNLNREKRYEILPVVGNDVVGVKVVQNF